MNAQASQDWVKTYKILTKRNWIILCLMTALSFVWRHHPFTLGVMIGGLLAIFNFNLLQEVLCRAFPKDKQEKIKKAPVILKAFLRLLFLGAVILLVIARKWVDPIGLTLGLSIIVLSIISYGIQHAWNSKRLER